MENLGRKIVKLRIPIFIISLLLLIPAGIGYINTRVNYDILYYLPEEIETMKGQDILVDEFGTGAYSMFICQGMDNKDVAKLKGQIEDVPYVSKVVWYDSFADLRIPMDILPEKIRSAFNTEDSTMMFIIFETTTSADETMEAIGNIRNLAGKQCFLSGMSAVVTDTKNLAEEEVVIYVVIAVLLLTVVLMVSMESWLIPFIFLGGIGIAIIYNLGTNIVTGEISYITQALCAVLQLGVTMDYSIFLWHSYQEQLEEWGDDHGEAMARAIAATIKSVVGSSITTIAGFFALCFMSFTLGLDLGVVMMKGVVFGVVCCVTVLPSMILIFDKALAKTKHRSLIPELPKVSEFIVDHHTLFAIIFVILFIPFAWFQAHTDVYYNLDSTLPKELPSIQANTLLQEDYEMGAAHMILLDRNMDEKEKYKMIDEMEQVDGVKQVLGLESIIGPTFPQSMIPEDVQDILESENYELMLIMNEYAVASDEVNEQLVSLNSILKSHDPNGMLVGEAPCTKDLIEITDHDFSVVSAVSILAVFAIILIVFGSISLPVVLVLVIEGAIFINMGIPYLTGGVLPFIASIVIGTIQLGSTVDYAILMTSRYEKERGAGNSKRDSILTAHRASMRSVVISACGFFAATFGVAMYSQIDMISSLCLLMARGALISMCAVLLFLPAMYWLFDGIICKTSKNFRIKKAGGK
ncbi:MAG TPA: hypothetical protein DF613_03880 [Lachnospiraceae bacterium]|nr:hypothetical protein [Lachnospiraceae bacterium]